MKILYFGGQKSGKSLRAEQKTLELAGKHTPFYLATYNKAYDDTEMQVRIAKHQTQRKETFLTLEETHDLANQIKAGRHYLIDCMSMWILNTLEEDDAYIERELQALAQCQATIVFVLNDVGSGIIPTEALSRKYIDRSGWVGQKLAQLCDEVYEVKLGLEIQLK